MEKKQVVNGTIGSDTHVIGTRMLQFALEQEGFAVTCLGAFVSQKEFIDAALEVGAAAILVSSIYGQAEMDCQGLREKCREAGLDHILLYLGGNVVIDYSAAAWPQVEAKFKDMGFDRVYPPGCPLARTITDLKLDLGLA